MFGSFLPKGACLNLVDLSKSSSLHVPSSQFLFERDSYSNEYLFAKFGFDTVTLFLPLRYLQFLRIVRFTSQPASQPRTSPPTFDKFSSIWQNFGEITARSCAWRSTSYRESSACAPNTYSEPFAARRDRPLPPSPFLHSASTAHFSRRERAGNPIPKGVRRGGSSWRLYRRVLWRLSRTQRTK